MKRTNWVKEFCEFFGVSPTEFKRFWTSLTSQEQFEYQMELAKATHEPVSIF